MRDGNCPDAEPEKEYHHDQSNRHSDRRPVRNRRFRSSSCCFGFRLGFGRRLDAGRFGTGSFCTSRFGPGGQEGRAQESSQSQRIGFGIGRSVGASTGSSSAGSQQVI